MGKTSRITTIRMMDAAGTRVGDGLNGSDMNGTNDAAEFIPVTNLTWDIDSTVDGYTQLNYSMNNWSFNLSYGEDSRDDLFYWIAEVPTGLSSQTYNGSTWIESYNFGAP